LGARAEQWNDKVLMFTGDVVGSQVPQAVFLPPLLLSTVTDKVSVHPLNQQLLNFHANDNMEVQEPVEADTPAAMIEKIGTCHAMYLLAQLVPLFLTQRRAPRDALMAVHTVLIETGDLEAFKPPVDWLCVAVTRDGATAIERASGPASPIMENRLHERLIQLVKQDLPGWEQVVQTPNQQGGGRPPSLSLEELMAQFLLNQLRGAQANATTEDSDKNPSKVWKGTINVLLHLTQRAAEEDLPQLWHAWANCKKEERRAVLQEQF
jgi:hypothetical protein